MNKMYLVLGDWSDDGHGKYDKVLVEVNKTVEKVQEAYKEACKLTGICFNNSNQNYTGLKRGYKEADEHSICTSYEEGSVNDTCKAILAQHGIVLEEYYNDSETWFTELWFKFVKLALPDLEYNIPQEKDAIPNINGYWNKNLNVQFGYGLYH